MNSKMKNKKLPHYRNNSKTQSKNRKKPRGKIDNPSKHISDCSRSWLGTGTSITIGSVKQRRNIMHYVIISMFVYS